VDATGGAVEKPADGDVPTHVAIIMDGNGRWARQRQLPRIAGHQQGMEAARGVVQAAGECGVSYLTLFGFSTENWRRPTDEVRGLMGLLRLYLRNEMDKIVENRVRLRFIGERHRLPGDIVAQMAAAEQRTADNQGLHLTIALSYGGRADLVHAARRLAERARDGVIDPAALSEDSLTAELSTASLPDVDLLVRTSGEQRLSNFLIWECAYAELVFVDTLWPDFGRTELEAAMDQYRRRERRFGAVAG